MPLKIKDALTDEHDSFDGLLAALLGAILFGIFLTGWSFFVRDQAFDFEKFGMGIAVIAGAGGAGYGAKRLGEKYGNRGTGVSDS
jgi:hypothetical protein